MVIIYGFGQYMNMLMEEYFIPINEVELIIDNELAKRNIYVGNIRIISYNEYLQNRKLFKSDKIVIGAKAHYNEIKVQLLESGAFFDDNILYVDEWVKNFQRKNSFLNGAIKESADKDLKKLLKEAGELNEAALKNARVLTNRKEVCKYIPQNCIAAEIGVAFGEFSKIILDLIQPRKFYAVDMFSEKTKGFWGNDIFYTNGITHYEWYEKQFSDYIDKGIMEMKKGISWDCMEMFPDDYFDYVYLDAAHDFDSVSKDIAVLKRKIRKGGIIQFNDYSQREWYGVIPAVNMLVNNTDSEVLYYCLSLDGTDDIVVRLNK